MLGSGGREHSICWKLKTSPLLSSLHCLPGNAGIKDVAECVSGISVADVPAVVAWAKANAIDFVVVGPEDPLTLGVVDELEKVGILAFGPTAAGAELEGSKAFMKDVLRKANVPSATYLRTTSPADAKEYIKKTGAPIVVKASGLCAGKGVILCATDAEAYQAIDDMMVNKIFKVLPISPEPLRVLNLVPRVVRAPLVLSADASRCHTSMRVSIPAFLAAATLEATQGHILSQSPTDATSRR